MRPKSILKESIAAGQDEILLLTNAISDDARFNVQRQISIDRGYFFVDIWKDGLHHCYLSNANSWPGESYLIEKIQETVTKLRAICKEFDIQVGTKKAKTNNVVPLTNSQLPARVQLYSGKVFDYANIQNMHFDIEDIAHSLSMICRFNGHTKHFYSVAQHSVLVSELVPEEHALAALLHDAAEAYCGDIVSPLKQLLPVYQTIHDNIEQSLFKSVGVQWPAPACVKDADLKMLATEVRDLMNPHPSYWAFINDQVPCEEIIHPLPPMGAKELFLDRYFSLQAKAAALAANA
ncbi:hypothetical protein KUL42_32790 [Alteromonas sp. KUL42]|uniref:hypothetical protein n=1 Tax=Alteromonas sp. KUL42 TaxID=2480797 RepID=UPI0010FFAB9A|nr:hypothetical protein [Alteromonas sp. KUL42]GEA08518.1 hypothetical protein KUL42_32790 [Alteromonas sp. KUL42]